MLKTYRIIPVVFILFLFGFTLITVSPVIAQPDCTPDPIMMGGKFWASYPNARSYQECMGRCNASTSPAVAPTAPSGGEFAQLNAKIAELEAENATLREQQGAPADPFGGEVGQVNARIDELKSDLKYS